ncbi:alpha/beta hydrolase [Streptomyces sp. NPDC056704]|uniref:alpha/beta hydrolase n=1 Tax=Streptomyces sp. NPDC056704 TaxID=3345917 RepID=UPI0036AEEB88
MGISTETQQFAQFLESVRAKASPPALDLAVVRDIVDTHASASTEPEGVTYADVDADGVPALWVIPEGADPDKALLHFHFGGSVAASISSDRKAAGHIAKAAGARSLVVSFRLAPEYPHPAQFDDAETAYRWLLAQGYEPRNIGSTGHSIGGTLAVALPLRLLAKGEAAPPGRSSASRRGPTSPSATRRWTRTRNSTRCSAGTSSSSSERLGCRTPAWTSPTPTSAS